METINVMDRKSERGFTLVELAIVMIIIGLLIGGILKGQELVMNAQIASTVGQVKAIDAASTAFRDKYDAFPGDMQNPATRLSNCTAAPCSAGGDGNSKLDSNRPNAAPAGENQVFFVHLAAADLLSTVSINGTPAGSWGGLYPKANVGGGFQAAHNALAALGNNTASATGHYLALVSTAGTAPQAAAANTTLTNLQAARIDRKLDDGSSTAGSVFGNRAACDYNEITSGTQCDLYIRFQN